VNRCMTIWRTIFSHRCQRCIISPQTLMWWVHGHGYPSLA